MADSLVILIDTESANEALTALRESFVTLGEAAVEFAATATEAINSFSDAFNNIKGFDPAVTNSLNQVNEALAGINIQTLDDLKAKFDELGAASLDQVAEKTQQVSENLDRVRAPQGLSEAASNFNKLGEGAQKASEGLQRAAPSAQQTETALRTMERELLNAAGFIGNFGVRVGSLVQAFNTLQAGGTSAGTIFQTLSARMGTITAAASLVTVAVQGIKNVFETLSSVLEPIIEIHEQFERLSAAVAGFTQSAEAGVRAQQDVVSIAQETGQTLSTVSDGYKQIASTAKQAGISTDEASNLVRNLSVAMTAVGASAGTTSQVFDQFSRALATGVVDSQLLTRTLGREAPQVLQVWARAMGTSVAGLKEMSQAGELGRESILALSNAIANDTATQDAFAKQMAGTGAAINKLSSVWDNLVNSFAGGSRDSFTFTTYLAEGINAIASAMDNPSFRQFADIIGSTLGLALDLLLTAVSLVIRVFTTLGAVIGFVVTSLGSLWESLASATVSFFKMNDTMKDTTRLEGAVVTATSNLSKVIDSDLGSALVGAITKMNSFGQAQRDAKIEVEALNIANRETSNELDAQKKDSADAQRSQEEYTSGINRQIRALESQKQALEQQKQRFSTLNQVMAGSGKETDNFKLSNQGLDRQIQSMDNSIKNLRLGLQNESDSYNDAKRRSDAYARSLEDQQKIRQKAIADLKLYGTALTDANKLLDDELVKLGKTREEANELVGSYQQLTKTENERTQEASKRIADDKKSLDNYTTMIDKLKQLNDVDAENIKRNPQSTAVYKANIDARTKLIKTLDDERAAAASDLVQQTGLQAAMDGTTNVAERMKDTISELNQQYGVSSEKITEWANKYPYLAAALNVVWSILQAVVGWIYNSWVSGIDVILTSIDDLIAKFSPLNGAVAALWEGLKSAADIIVTSINKIIGVFKSALDIINKAIGAIQKFFSLGGGKAASEAASGGDSASSQRQGGYSEHALESQRVSASAFDGAPKLAQGIDTTDKLIPKVSGGGIPTILHPNEAVVPLSRGRTIPVNLNLDKNDTDTSKLSAIKDLASSTLTITPAINNMTNQLRVIADAMALYAEAQKFAEVPIIKTTNSGVTTPQSIIAPVQPSISVDLPNPSRPSEKSSSPNSIRTDRRANYQIKMDIHTKDADSFKRSQDQIIGDLGRKIKRVDSRGG